MGRIQQTVGKDTEASSVFLHMGVHGLIENPKYAGDSKTMFTIKNCNMGHTLGL